MMTQTDSSQASVTVAGRLAIKTLRGRYGDFNVGRLQCRLGTFWVKEKELDQYKEGKYSGIFDLDHIGPHAYFTNGRSVTEVRAWMLRMSLDGVARLSTDDSSAFASQDSDPAEQEGPQSSLPPRVTEQPPSVQQPPVAQLAGANDERKGDPESPKPVEGAPSSAAQDGEEREDVALFGTLWPLGENFKLDTTVDRFLIRKQTKRLHQLGYEHDFHRQEWHRKAA